MFARLVERSRAYRNQINRSRDLSDFVSCGLYDVSLDLYKPSRLRASRNVLSRVYKTLACGVNQEQKLFTRVTSTDGARRWTGGYGTGVSPTNVMADLHARERRSDCVEVRRMIKRRGMIE